MDISILTLYGANNVGAFLQAFSMQSVLEELCTTGKVSFIRFPSAQQSKMKKALRYFKSLKFSKLYFKYKTSKKYAVVMKKLNIDDEVFSESRQYDTIVVGSDEVWNITSNTFSHLPQYFAHNIKANNIISYAPSAGNTKPEEVAGANIDFSGFNSLSVRDDNTFDIVKKIDGRTPVIVCDPTLLIESFDPYIRPVEEKDYILIYNYELDKQSIKDIKNYAKSHNKKLISVGVHNGWCDKNIVADPIEFLSWLASADQVITSTFHGTVLSVKLHKQVAVYAHTSNKIKGFLKQIGLEAINVSKVKNLSAVLENPIPYDLVEKKIKEFRETSMKYLKGALENKND